MRSQRGNRALTPIFFVVVAGCSTIDHQRVEGWPELAVVEHRVPAEEMIARCQKYTGAGSMPLACAEFNLLARRCDIWLSRSFAPRAIVAHERLHCAGYDHVGSTNMQRFLQAHLENRGQSPISRIPTTPPEVGL